MTGLGIGAGMSGGCILVALVGLVFAGAMCSRVADRARQNISKSKPAEEAAKKKAEDDPAKHVATAEERRNFDKETADIFVKNGAGIISSCEIDSSLVPANGSVLVYLYFSTIPGDFEESLKYIVKQVHSIYKSGVSLTAYERLATGARVKLATCEFDLFSSKLTFTKE